MRFGGVHLGLLAMFIRRRGVLSCFRMFALSMPMRRFVMMMRCGGMMSRGKQMMIYRGRNIGHDLVSQAWKACTTQRRPKVTEVCSIAAMPVLIYRNMRRLM